MKVAVTGKGGAGKTTVAAAIARCWRDLGHEVTAVDADPDANLAGTLGYRGPEIVPLVQLKALVEERVGGSDGWGGFLRMNPRVDDVPAEIGTLVDGIRLLVMGTIAPGRRGCACPENVLLREVLAHLVLGDRQRLVVDMEAGIEHLGRRTAEGVDWMLVVVEPGWASLQTAERIAGLGQDLGIRRLAAIANKVASEEEAAFIHTGLGALPLLATLPFEGDLERQAQQGRFSSGTPYSAAILGLVRQLG